jgi:hypothetical protein
MLLKQTQYHLPFVDASLIHNGGPSDWIGWITLGASPNLFRGMISLSVFLSVHDVHAKNTFTLPYVRLLIRDVFFVIAPSLPRSTVMIVP